MYYQNYNIKVILYYRKYNIKVRLYSQKYYIGKIKYNMSNFAMIKDEPQIIVFMILNIIPTKITHVLEVWMYI